MRLAQTVGLDLKLERENLTVFVPSDEALLSYMQTQQLESVIILSAKKFIK